MSYLPPKLRSSVSKKMCSQCSKCFVSSICLKSTEYDNCGYFNHTLINNKTS